MADDPDRDLIPIKDDTKGSYIPPSIAHTEPSDVLGQDRPTVLEKRVAEQLSRSDLEDQLYKLRDENLELKKTSRKQEEQLKKLATKMSRLLNEKKKADTHFSPSRKRDIEMEEALEELHDKVRNLEKSNVQLREKLLVAKQQVIKQTQRPNAYNYVAPKVNSGRPRSGISPYIISANVRGNNPQNNQRTNPSTLPPYVIQLLDEARNELFNLKELVATQRNEIDMYEQEVELLRERLRMKDTEFDEELNILKSQITEGQRHHVQENLDLIRLHRELKQKNSKIISLQAQLTDMDEKLRNQRSNQDRLVKEIEEKASQIRDEQKKSVEFVTELQKNKVALHNLDELQDSYKALKKENDVLKDTNDKLIKSVLNQDRDRSNQSAENLLKDRITQLEQLLSSEVKEKNLLKENFKEEKDKSLKLSEEHLNLQNAFSEVKKQTEELESKMNILKEEDVDFEELGEALALIKLKKQRSLKINFLNSSPNQEEEEDLKSKLMKAEKEHSETIKELCNVREMLMTQYKINKDAQEELKTVSESFSQKEKEYQTKLEEYANLLDMRAAKIQKLERQLNDIVYGTKKIKIEEYQEPQAETIETLELSKGENLFEIHVIKFVYSDEGLKLLKNSNPSSFLTWNFYEFELQSSPVVKGPNPHFGCSAQYRVKVDDFFLFYLHKNTATIELHESLGTDYRTLATGQLNFSELLEQPHGRLHCMQHLISTQESSHVVFGVVYFWVKLHVPMEEAFKLYKQKFKALKYIQNNQIASAAAMKMLDQPLKKNSCTNDLHIKIIRCSNLKIQSTNSQPSSFCIYKFYNFPDHDTSIIPTSNNPEFSDHRAFSVCANNDFEKYLRTQNLDIFVFDNDDLDVGSYIGKASVPLIPLSKGKSIKGIFELTKDGIDASFGSVEVSLYWQHGYESSPSTSLPSQLESPIEFPAHIAPVTPVLLDNDLSKISDHELSSGPPAKPPRTSKQSPPSSSKPLRTSTPIKRLSNSSNTTTSSIEELARMNLDVQDAQASTTNHNRTQKITGSTRHSPASEKSGSSHMSKKSTARNEGVFFEQHKSDSSSSKSHNSATSSKNATFTKEKHDLVFDEMTDEDKQALPDSDTSSESEHVLRVTHSSPAKPDESHTMPSIVIGINELSLKPGSSVLSDSSVQMLYVEFKFLDYPLEELETPYSLPKPIPPDSIRFDCKKVFMFHPEKNLEKYKLLAQMFNPEMPEASWIKFTVVSEPPTDEEGLECEDVGYAYVDLREILRRGNDIRDEVLSIYDAKAAETEIGKLTVTVEALAVLQLL